MSFKQRTQRSLSSSSVGALASSRRALLEKGRSSWLSLRRTRTQPETFGEEENIIATDDVVSAEYVLSKIKQAQTSLQLTKIEFEDLVLKKDEREAIFHATKNLLAWDGSRTWRYIKFTDHIHVQNSGDGAVQQLKNYVIQQDALRLKISRVSRGKPVTFETKLEIHAGTDVNAICDLFSALRHLNVKKMEFGGSLFSIKEDKIAKHLSGLCCSPGECDAADPNGAGTVLGEMILITIFWAKSGDSSLSATDASSAKTLLTVCILELNCLVALRLCCQEQPVPRPSSSSFSETSSSKKGRRSNMHVVRSTGIATVMKQKEKAPRKLPLRSRSVSLPSLEEIEKKEAKVKRTKSATNMHVVRSTGIATVMNQNEKAPRNLPLRSRSVSLPSFEEIEKKEAKVKRTKSATTGLDHLRSLNASRRTPRTVVNAPKRLARRTTGRSSGMIRVSRQDRISSWKSMQTLGKSGSPNSKSLDSDHGPGQASAEKCSAGKSSPLEEKLEAPSGKTETKKTAKGPNELTRRHTSTSMRSAGGCSPTKLERSLSVDSRMAADYDWVQNRATGCHNTLPLAKEKPDFRWDELHNDTNFPQLAALSA